MLSTLRLPLIALLATGCAADPARGPGIDSHVEYYDVGATVPPALDILIVLDNTTAMAPYQTGLAALPAGIEAALRQEQTSQPDTRIAVVTADGTGAFRQPAASSDAFIALGYDVHLERTTNFTGSFADALAQLIGVGAAASSTLQPLESAKQGLDAHPEFLRNGTRLGIVTIAASDDASPGAVLDYATSLKARTPDPVRVGVSGIYAAPATRLDAFHMAFPGRASVVDIATADFANALGDLLDYISVPIGDLVCFREPADVDAATDGPQYDCDLNGYYDDDSTVAVRQCQPGSTGPCFTFTIDPLCPDAGLRRFIVRGFPTAYTPTIHGQCVVTGT